LIIPTISAIARDVLLVIPNNQREASLALGATKWETISKVLIPYGLSGILGAIVIGLGRAIGETMAVTMVIGNSIDGSISLLRPGYTMASILANQFAEVNSPIIMRFDRSRINSYFGSYDFLIFWLDCWCGGLVSAILRSRWHD